MFETLADYVKWRNERRVVYERLTKAIRTIKAGIIATTKRDKYAGLMQVSLLSLRQDARTMMEQRKLAKETARRSWIKWKTQESS